MSLQRGSGRQGGYERGRDNGRWDGYKGGGVGEGREWGRRLLYAEDAGHPLRLLYAEDAGQVGSVQMGGEAQLRIATSYITQYVCKKNKDLRNSNTSTPILRQLLCNICQTYTHIYHAYSSLHWNISHNNSQPCSPSQHIANIN